jgi:hypothetical protein
MPTSLTGSASYTGTVDGPSAGEVAQSAAMRGSLQTLINNDAYFASLIGTSGSGTMKIKTFANKAALIADTTAINGDVVLMVTHPSGGTTVPTFWRRNTSGSGSDTRDYLDASTGSGGWDLIRSPASLYIAEYKDTQAWGTTIVSTTSTSWVDATNVYAELSNCAAEDKIVIGVSLLLERGDVAQTAYARLAVTENGGADIVLSETERRIAMDAGDVRFRTDFCINTVRTIVTAGTLRVKAQYKTSNAGSAAAFKSPGSMALTLSRY